MHEFRIVAVNGHLGYGFLTSSLQRGLEAEPHLVAADAGSTDAGPYYLGSGDQLTKPPSVAHDLRRALVGARALGVPLIVGSAGMAGGRPHVQSLLDILRRVAGEEGLHFQLAVIDAEVPKQTVLDGLADGRISSMPGVPPLSAEQIRDSERIVGQMGPEPFVEALEGGAEVVIAGRSCDTALFAAMPISKGFDVGLAMHMAKIMECGAQCALPLAANDSLLGILRQDHFLVRPLDPERRCSPHSVAAHALYEQAHPHLIHEPGGTIDLQEAEYEQVDERTVRVSGSRWVSTEPFAIKLEGARKVGYRTVTFAGVRDDAVIRNLDSIMAHVRASVADQLQDQIAADDYQLNVRVYGRDAVLGSLEPSPRPGHEVGVLLEAIAPTQDLSDTILALARSGALHCPFEGRKTTAGNLAFPFSPSDFRGGPVYEFSVYHLLETRGERLFTPEFSSI